MSKMEYCTAAQASAAAAFISGALSSDRLIWINGKKFRIRDASEGKTTPQERPHIIQTSDGIAIGIRGLIFAFALETASL